MPQRAKIYARHDKNISRQWPFVDMPCDTPNGGGGGGEDPTPERNSIVNQLAQQREWMDPVTTCP